MTFDTVRALADRAALFTALRQDQLVAAVDALGEHRWDADLTAGRFTFAAEDDPGRTLDAVPQLIASIAPGPRSLRWAWDLDGHDSTPAADGIRAYGVEHAVAELVEGEVPLPDDADDDEGMAALAHAVAGAAVEITGRSPYYLARVGRTTAVLLLDAPIPALTVSAALTVMPRILSTVEMRDARGCVWDLARLAGWHLQWTDDAFSAARVTDATGAATFRFDERARIANIEASLSRSAS